MAKTRSSQSLTILSLVSLAFAALLAAPAPAQASMVVACGEYTYGPITVPTPFLVTAYGWVSFGTIESGTAHGPRAQPGFYSANNRTFNPTNVAASVQSEDAYINWANAASDGVVGLVCGSRSVNSAYGPVIYGIQFDNGQGRWGNYNLQSHLFYPDGSGWSPVAY
jgi:hypothetical protein